MKFPDSQYALQANSISENAITSATPIYIKLIERLKGFVGTSETYGEAQRILQRYAVDEGFIHNFQSILFDGMSTEDALARSFVVDKDRHFSIVRNRIAAKFELDGAIVSFTDAGWIVLKDDRVRISFDLVPAEAVRLMRERSFWISGIQNQELLKRVQKALEDALAYGKTWEDFQVKVNGMFDEMMEPRLVQHRLEMVFRTNLFSAYAKAQIEQLERMPDRFPLWRYSAILDSRTRPAHAALDGTVWRIGEGPYPPLQNGTDSEGNLTSGMAFNCRCTAQHLHTFEIQEQRGVSVRVMGERQVLEIRDGQKYSLKQIISDEERAFRKYISEAQASMNPSILSAIRSKLD